MSDSSARRLLTRSVPRIGSQSSAVRPRPTAERTSSGLSTPRPAAHPLRILIATDAAREGLNLQRHCRDLFHFDLPWNPSRLEQRNGRIDRKLQPAPRVYCRYFIYAQRPEDRVLRRLVEKTEIIRKQLGSASPVIETRISELLAGGIDRQNADRVVAEIDRIEQSDKERRARDDLEPVREADARLARRIEQLRSQLGRSQRRVGVDRVQLRRVVTFGLKLAGAPALHETETETGPQRFEFRADEVAAIRDEGLGRIIGRCAIRRIGSVPERCGRYRSSRRWTPMPRPFSSISNTRW